MLSQNNNYIIGVDGGGTKTTAALANLAGNILKIGKADSASPRNVGIKKATENIIRAVTNVLPPQSKNYKIVSIFIGLPAVEEEFGSEIKKIKEVFLREKKISQALSGKLTIGSDQLVAFWSGSDKKEGVVLIAGTGCVAHGWKGRKEDKASGWGWLADEGSGFWIGQKVFQAILKDLDGRGEKTLLTDFVLRKFKVKRPSSILLNRKIYSQDFIKVVSSLSLICDLACKKGDKIAKSILTETAEELAASVKTIIKKLSFSKKKFPLVLVGSVLKSKVVLNTFKREIKKIASKVDFIVPKEDPVVGAVKLTIEAIKNKKICYRWLRHQFKN